MVSKFREHLPILHGPPDDPGVRMSVCAMGPVTPGDTIHWMRVWVWQQVDERLAASSGASGMHLGAHAPSDMETLPFTDTKGWMIQTELEPGAEQFTDGRPALAMALALVEHSDGSRDVEQWNQGVSIGSAHPEHGSAHPEH
jgi:hypothetical protein